MSRGSDWHKNTQEKIIEEYKQKGYSAKKEKKIGFDDKITRKTQFKRVDIVAKKDNEIALIEIEDRKYHTKEYGTCDYGVGYVELGGILSLSCLFSELEQNKNKHITLLLVFRDNIISFRRNNIKKIIENIRKNCKKLTIKIQFRDKKGNKI